MTLQHNNTLILRLAEFILHTKQSTPPRSRRSARVRTVCTSWTPNVLLRRLVSQNLEFIFPSIAPEGKPENRWAL